MNAEFTEATNDIESAETAVLLHLNAKMEDYISTARWSIAKHTILKNRPFLVAERVVEILESESLTANQTSTYDTAVAIYLIALADSNYSGLVSYIANWVLFGEQHHLYWWAQRIASGIMRGYFAKANAEFHKGDRLPAVAGRCIP